MRLEIPLSKEVSVYADPNERLRIKTTDGSGSNEVSLFYREAVELRAALDIYIKHFGPAPEQ